MGRGPLQGQSPASEGQGRLGIFSSLLLGHFNPNDDFFAIGVGLALGVFLARQEATGRIELLPQVHLPLPDTHNHTHNLIMAAIHYHQ